MVFFKKRSKKFPKFNFPLFFQFYKGKTFGSEFFYSYTLFVESDGEKLGENKEWSPESVNFLVCSTTIF